MASRRDRALGLIERLHRVEVEARAVELGGLRERMADLERQSAETAEALARDGRITSIESAPYVGAYIRDARAQIGALDRARKDLEPQAEALEEAMRESFREMKTVSTVAARARLRAARDRAAREAAETDEMVLLRWGRDG
ncbi:flagellar FliJ family protein [Limimaricola cinnabarinus]|uniref:flagellar FliJ family protein n=1 Tax=Limimaricola cinnabarinus TaxID=1125964 RepID=UPI0024925C74|nr:flagellar FliJ family protein [Limimaricola cinnabarinus]